MTDRLINNENERMFVEHWTCLAGFTFMSDLRDSQVADEIMNIKHESPELVGYNYALAVLGHVKDNHQDVYQEFVQKFDEEKKQKFAEIGISSIDELIPGNGDLPDSDPYSVYNGLELDPFC